MTYPLLIAELRASWPAGGTHLAVSGLPGGADHYYVWCPSRATAEAWLDRLEDGATHTVLALDQIDDCRYADGTYIYQAPKTPHDVLCLLVEHGAVEGHGDYRRECRDVSDLLWTAPADPKVVALIWAARP